MCCCLSTVALSPTDTSRGGVAIGDFARAIANSAPLRAAANRKVEDGSSGRAFATFAAARPVGTCCGSDATLSAQQSARPTESRATAAMPAAVGNAAASRARLKTSQCPQISVSVIRNR